MNDLLAKHKTFKLQIELVPQSCWYSNVREIVSSKQWDAIRKKVYFDANDHCEVCGGQGKKHPVECHEIWAYDDETNIQKLTKFIALCPLCHEVVHMGLAEVRGSGKRALKRFADINGISYSIAQKIRDSVFTQWQLRSNLKWKLDVSFLDTFNTDIELPGVQFI
jgi:hypothetical protein